MEPESSLSHPQEPSTYPDLHLTDFNLYLVQIEIEAAGNLYLSFSLAEISSGELKKVCAYYVGRGDKHI
jgi:hypothetical protein